MCVLQVLPSADTGQRLLAAIDLTKAAPTKDTDKASKANKRTRLTAGTIVPVTIANHAPSGAYIDITVNDKTQGRIHACDIQDLPTPEALWEAQTLLASDIQAGGVTDGDSGENGRPAKKQKKATTAQKGAASVSPELRAWVTGEKTVFDKLAQGSVLDAVVVPAAGAGTKAGQVKHHGIFDFATRESALAAARAAAAAGGGDAATVAPTTLQFSQLHVSQLVVGVVTETHADHVWVSLSPSVRGRLHVLDSAPAGADPRALRRFRERFREGRVVAVRVAAVDAAHHTLDLTLTHTHTATTTITPTTPTTTKKSSKSSEPTHPHVTCAALARAAAAGASAVVKALPVGATVMGRLVLPGSGGGGDTGGLVRVNLGGRLHGQVGVLGAHVHTCDLRTNIHTTPSSGALLTLPIIVTYMHNHALRTRPASTWPLGHFAMRSAHGSCACLTPCLSCVGTHTSHLKPLFILSNVGLCEFCRISFAIDVIHVLRTRPEFTQHLWRMHVMLDACVHVYRAWALLALSDTQGVVAYSCLPRVSLHAQVALTDIRDEWCANVLSGLPKEDCYVRAVVVGVEGPTQDGEEGAKMPRIHLTLRRSKGGDVAGKCLTHTHTHTHTHAHTGTNTPLSCLLCPTSREVLQMYRQDKARNVYLYL